MSTVHDRRKALRGTKRTCQACEIRFYDLGRNPIVCPTCGAELNLGPCNCAPTSVDPRWEGLRKLREEQR